MKLQDFRDLLLTADPKASHYKSTQTGNYTVWTEYSEVFHTADDQIHDSVLRVQVDRYTKMEYDPMVSTITQALDVPEVLVIDRRILFERDSGYIHHIWDCEVTL